MTTTRSGYTNERETPVSGQECDICRIYSANQYEIRPATIRWDGVIAFTGQAVHVSLCQEHYNERNRPAATYVVVSDEELQAERDAAYRQRELDADKRRIAADHAARCPWLAGLEW